MSHSTSVLALGLLASACGEGGLGGGSRPTVNEGTTIATTATETISSKTHKAGDRVVVRVSTPVADSAGRTVIPAGADITLEITAIAPGPNRGDRGTLELAVRDVVIDGASHGLDARVSDYGFEMKGSGVGVEEVAKTGAGALAGGIIARVVGGEDKTAIGAVGGAAAGAAIADHSQDRDIVVAAGNSVTLVLTGNFSATQ